MGVDFNYCIFCEECVWEGDFEQCDECYDLIACNECKGKYKCDCELTDKENKELTKLDYKLATIKEKINFIYLK